MVWLAENAGSNWRFQSKAIAKSTMPGTIVEAKSHRLQMASVHNLRTAGEANNCESERLNCTVFGTTKS